MYIRAAHFFMTVVFFHSGNDVQLLCLAEAVISLKVYYTGTGFKPSTPCSW